MEMYPYLAAAFPGACEIPILNSYLFRKFFQ